MGYPAATRSAFQYGLVIFALTALLGLANATQLFGALDRNTLLTHLHSGTLGWITMGVIGLSVWLFGAEGKNTAIRVSAASTAAYVLAFWSGNFYARGIFGVTELAVVYYWWWFVVSRGMAEGFGRLDIPKLSVIFGLTTLAIGSTLGVIVQVILATGGTVPQSPDLIGAHASAQTGGYLVLVAAGFIEWQLTGGGRRTTAGLVQIALLFVSGLLLAFSLLLAGAARHRDGPVAHRCRRRRRQAGTRGDRRVLGRRGKALSRPRRWFPRARQDPRGRPRPAVHRLAG
jgi:hypothetical protein